MKPGGPDFREAGEELARRIKTAVRDSVSGEERVAVAFSGGLDSSILALCASRETSVVACSGYVPGAPDEERARSAAKELGLDLVQVVLEPALVAASLNRMELPFEASLMDRSLWCLYSAISGAAQDAGARVMLLGQLSDELFGGYAKYAEALEKGGAPAAEKMMQDDVEGFPARGRVRDVASCGSRVEARFPFEAKRVVEFASSMPVGFKIRSGVRKAILREAGLVLGLPSGLADAPKKAAQYSSGVQRFLARAPF